MNKTITEIKSSEFKSGFLLAMKMVLTLLEDDSITIDEIRTGLKSSTRLWELLKELDENK